MAGTRPLQNVAAGIEGRLPAGELGADGHRLTNGGVSGNRRIDPSCPCLLHYYITPCSERRQGCATVVCVPCPELRAPAERHTTSCMVGCGQGLREHALAPCFGLRLHNAASVCKLARAAVSARAAKQNEHRQQRARSRRHLIGLSAACEVTFDLEPLSATEGMTKRHPNGRRP